MFIQKTNVEGLAIIEPRLLKDARGYFFESFSQREFEEKVRKVNFVQDNESMSSYGVMRGLHFQKPDNKAILSENDTKHPLLGDLEKALARKYPICIIRMNIHLCTKDKIG